MPEIFTAQSRITSVSGTSIVPFLGAEDRGYYLQSLRLKISCPSLAEADIPNLEPELTRAERIKIIRDLEWLSPRRELEVLQKVGNGEYVVLARVSCLNRPPFYAINLLQFLTDNADYPLGTDAYLAFRVRNAGHGLLAGADELIVFGSGVSEAIAVAPGSPGGLGNCTSSLSQVSSTAIAIAPDQPGRTYLSVSVQSENQVWLGLGTKPKIGSGILLLGQGSSYELNNYQGAIYAIAEQATTVSVTLCT
jgi:hypothetical protein